MGVAQNASGSAAVVGVEVEGEKVTTVKQKEKILTKDSFFQTNETLAIGLVNGATIVKMCFNPDEDGSGDVCVILKASSDLAVIAECLRKGIKLPFEGKGRSLQSIIPKTTQQWFNALGSRVFFDETGSPCVVSVGFGTYTKTDNKCKSANLKDAAKDSALKFADSFITTFASASLNSSSAETLGRLYEEKLNGTCDEDAMASELDEMYKEMKKNSTLDTGYIDKNGITSLKSKSITLENGTVCYFLMRKWSFSNVKKANKFKENQQSPKTSKGPKAKGSNGSKKGFKVDHFETEKEGDF
ncbi:MAG: hypothetical protein J6V41_05040 [Kiritimatiellae bacterium]|nr:hypothetical protein [Kiritimatiellia bacterium]